MPASFLQSSKLQGGKREKVCQMRRIQIRVGGGTGDRDSVQRRVWGTGDRNSVHLCWEPEGRMILA